MLSSAWCVFGASCSLKQNFMFQQWWHVCSPLALRGCPICREGVYKVCVTTGLWATRVCAVVGPSASRGEERNVKNSEQCPLQPLCVPLMLYLLIFEVFDFFTVLPFPVSSHFPFLISEHLLAVKRSLKRKSFPALLPRVT